MNFFMDLINYIAGYHEKHMNEISDKMSHEDLVKKYRAEKNQYSNNL